MLRRSSGRESDWRRLLDALLEVWIGPPSAEDAAAVVRLLLEPTDSLPHHFVDAVRRNDRVVELLRQHRFNDQQWCVLIHLTQNPQLEEKLVTFITDEIQAYSAAMARREIDEDPPQWLSWATIALLREAASGLDESRVQQLLEFQYRHATAFERLRMTFYAADERGLLQTLSARWRETNVADEELLQQIDEFGALAPCVSNIAYIAPPERCLFEAEALCRGVPGEMDRLATDLRILQWDLFVRESDDETRFDSVGDWSNADAIDMLPSPTFRDRLAIAEWRFYYNFHPTEAAPPRRRSRALRFAANAEPETLAMQASDGVETFRRIIDLVGEIQPKAHEDLRAYYSSRAAADHDAASIARRLVLLPDGELTFWGLLWLFGVDPGYVVFKGLDEQANPVFAPESFEGFMLANGLAAPLADGEFVVTNRWRTFLRWLSRHASPDLELTEFAKLIPDFERAGNWLLSRFRSRGRQIRPLVARGLRDRVDSVELEAIVSALRVLFTDPTKRPITDPTKQPHDLWNLRAVRLCRAGFLPLEWLLRSYQPNSRHLLILALGVTRPDGEASKGSRATLASPRSLGFVTVSGALATAIESARDTQSPETENPPGMADEDQRRAWIAPYWMLLSDVASELALAGFFETESAADRRWHRKLWPDRARRWFGTDQSHERPKDVPHTWSLATPDQRKLPVEYLENLIGPIPERWMLPGEAFGRVTEPPLWEQLKSFVGAYTKLHGRHNRPPYSNVDRSLTLGGLLLSTLVFMREIEEAEQVAIVMESFTWTEAAQARLFLPGDADKSQGHRRRLRSTIFKWRALVQTLVQFRDTPAKHPWHVEITTRDEVPALRFLVGFSYTTPGRGSQISLAQKLESTGGDTSEIIKAFVRACEQRCVYGPAELDGREATEIVVSADQES